MTLRKQKLLVKVGKAFLVAFLSTGLIKAIENEPLTFTGAHWAVWLITLGNAFTQALNTWDAFLSDPKTGLSTTPDTHETTPPPPLGGSQPAP